MSVSPSSLYYGSALLYAATIPKHTLVGLNSVAPAVSTIAEDTPTNRKMKLLLTPTWLHCNLWLVTSALLSAKWARLGGPSSTEEKAIVWAQLVVGGVVGWQYFKHNMYVGLGCLWAAPVAGAAALIWEN
ncbi:hypothetical protein Slin15195_G123660 [Septoria linicola]|uniref:Uncharacterized protein n=1 Tax=Septoria linicola TaxID=215465 RepID=A0A9Q9AZT3_9PEZI|nr:hypothetical protein Slin14017_G079860 [Septoria linicola]USW59047.1 hypothetical protein Slin15195_G123660 [Septoria linicola]